MAEPIDPNTGRPVTKPDVPATKPAGQKTKEELAREERDREQKNPR